VSQNDRLRREGANGKSALGRLVRGAFNAEDPGG